MYKIYGIPNCDTMKKAMDWLKQHHIPFTFHNYKTDGISRAKLKAWCKQGGWEQVLNKKSATWRSLDPTVQAAVNSEKAAIELMAEHNSCIKRPILEKAEQFLMAGFNPTQYEALLIHH
ncbi:MAG TPA: arsenate reductase [Sediminibacterium sp.]|nr:arsenate reductase [Sediminibacterium sp.]